MIYLKTSIGVEIRGNDLLLSCLRSNFSAAVFTRFERVRDFKTRDKAEVRSEIDRFIKGQKLGRENIVLGIPRQDAIIRHLDLPREVADNLKQVVLYQVQAFEPTEEEKFYFDYVSLSGKEAMRLLVLVVMIRKSVLDGYLEALREFGLRPLSVMVSTVALANLFLQTQADTRQKTFVLADLAPEGIEVLALRDRALVYSKRSVNLLRNPLTPDQEGQTLRDILRREVELAAEKVRLGPEDTIEKIVLTGEESETVQQEMIQDLGDCELLSSSIQFEMSAEEHAHLQEGTTSLGLAYSGIVRRPPMRLNLLPAELQVQQTRWAYVPSIILGALIVVLLLGLVFRQMIQEQILERKIDQEISSITGRVNQVQKLQAQTKALEDRITNLEGRLRNRDTNLELLQELTTILPQDTFLNMYTNRDCTITINGVSSSPDLIVKLERSPLLKNVGQSGEVFRDVQTGKDRFTIQGKCEK
jgi:Tfp pilus assembly PilM family ATPase/Tfp pilus assembly protein PilN